MWHFRLLCVYVLVVFKYSSSHNIYEIKNQLVENAHKEMENKKCIKYLIHNFWTTNQEVVVTNMKLDIFLNVSLISIELFNKDLAVTDRNMLIYVLDLRRDSMVLNFYHHLKDKYFLPRSKFVFVISMYEDCFVRELLKRISSFFICKVLIVDKELNIYTYFPYIYENAMDPHIEPLLLGSCFTINKTINSLNAQVYPKLWRNTTLHIYFRMVLPFVNENYTGSEQRLTDSIAKHLGIRLVPMLGASAFQGIKKNETYQNQGIALLNKGYIQAVAGGYQSDADLSKEFDSSSVYLIGSNSLIVPVALPRTYWASVWRILTPEVKMGLIVTAIAWNFFIYYVYGEKIENLIVLTLAILHQMPVPNFSKFKYRTALAFWLLGVFAYSNTSNCYFQLILYSTQNEYQMRSTADVVSSNIRSVLVTSEIFESFKDSFRKEDKLLFPKMAICKNEIHLTNNCISQLCKNQSVVLIGSKLVIMMTAIRQQECIDVKTGKVLYYIGEQIDSSFFQMYYVKGYPPLEALDTFIRRAILYAGGSEKEGSDLNAHYKRALAMSKKLKSKALNLNRIYFVFVILGFGIGISVVVFILEIYSSKVA